MTQPTKYYDPELAIVYQIQLEEKLDKNQLMPRLREQFADPENGLKDIIQGAEIPERFAVELLAQLSLRKSTDIVTLVGLLQHLCGDTCEGTSKDSKEPAQQAADYVTAAINAELVYYNHERDLITVCYDIDPKIQEELNLFQYPLPMVAEPRQVSHNLESAYVLGRGSIILAGQHHDQDVCLDHINRVNQVKFSLNMQTATMVSAQWKGLEKQKPDETITKFRKRQKAFEKYEKSTVKVLKTLQHYSPHIWLTHKYDKRGRTYCMGYHVSYQSTPWNKAILQLADEEIVE